MLSLKIGILLSFGSGICLSLLSIMVVTTVFGWFIDVLPLFLSLSGGDEGGFPIMYAGVEMDASSTSIRKITEFNPILFVLNTLVWSLPFLLTFLLVRYLLWGWLMQAAWHRWLFVLVLLGPALIELLIFCADILCCLNISPVFLTPLRGPLADSLSFSGDVLLRSPDAVLRFIKIAYLMLLSFPFGILLFALFHQQGVLFWRYPFAAVAVLLCVQLTESPRLFAYLAQKKTGPFTVERLAVSQKDVRYHILEYRLTSLQLPQENTLYRLDCDVYDRQVDLEYPLYHNTHTVKQVNGILYERVYETNFERHEFLERSSLDATIKMSSKFRPKYLWFAIESFDSSNSSGSEKKYRDWCIVPITEEMFTEPQKQPDMNADSIKVPPEQPLVQLRKTPKSVPEKNFMSEFDLIATRKLTEWSLKRLEKEQIPDEIMQHLKIIENQEFPDEKDFVKTLEKHIGGERTVQYKELILRYAESPGPERPRQYIENDFDVHNDIVLDRTTGLMWQEAGPKNSLNYHDALKYIEGLNKQQFAGYHDWRFPTVPELLSLVEPRQQSNGLHIDPIFPRAQPRCWSSDYVEGGLSLGSFTVPIVWAVYFGSGGVVSEQEEDYESGIRAVRP